METLKEILKTEVLIIKLNSLTLSNDDLIFLRDEIEHRQDLFFVNWGPNNISILNENVEIREQIDQKLIANILNSNSDYLVADLSECELYDSFIERFALDIEENRILGAVIFGQANQERFSNNESYQKIKKKVLENNENYVRFPSDYVHVLCTCHCNHMDDTDIWSKLEQMGWEIEQQLMDSDNNYVSVLYKNKVTKQLVLAFRGLKFKLENWCFGENKLEEKYYSMIGNGVTMHSSYAYLHSKTAFELSNSIRYTLSFTGYSFGAWLAEQGVYFCYEEFESTGVRAVTFDSPGSSDIIEELSRSNIHNASSKTYEELAKILDIKTYLFSPSFINTCNDHVGNVYRMFEKRSADLDTFVTQKVIGLIPLEKLKLRKKLEKWYNEICKPNMGKFYFYLYGLFTLLNDDVRWLANEFEEEEFKQNSKRIKNVKRWPKMKINKMDKKFEGLRLTDMLVSIDPFVGSKIPEVLRKVITKPIDWALNKSVKSISNNCFPTVTMIFHIVGDILSGKFDEEDSLKCFEFDQQMSQNILEENKKAKEQEEKQISKKTKIVDGTDFGIVFRNHYKLLDIELYSKNLELRYPLYIDSRLREFYYDVAGRFKSHECPLSDQFKAFKDCFEIKNEFDSMQYSKIVLKSPIYPQQTVERIKERFLRLEKVNSVYLEKPGWKKQTSNLINNQFVSEFNGDKNPAFVKSDRDENKFKKIDEKLENNNYVYLHGKRGVGKTTLAREYAYYRNEKLECNVQFISMSDLLMANIQEFKHRFVKEDDQVALDIIDCDQLIIVIKRNIEDIITSNEFSEILFVLDDVKNFDSVKPILDELKEQKFLIIVESDELMNKVDPEKKLGFKIENFSERDFFCFLSKFNIATNENEEFFKKYYHTCQDLDLTTKDIDNGIKYMLSHPTSSFDELEPFTKNDSHFKLTLLGKENRKSLFILKHLAYLDGSFVDMKVLKSVFGNLKKIEASLEVLMNYGFVRRVYEVNGNRGIEIHQKTRDEVRGYLVNKEMEKQRMISRVCKKLVKCIEKKSPKQSYNKRLIGQVNRHARQIVVEKWENKEKDENYSFLLKRLTDLNIEVLMLYDYAIDFLNCELEARNRAGEKSDKVMVDIYDKFGLIYWKIGLSKKEKLEFDSDNNYRKDLDEARKYYSKALELRQILMFDELEIAKTYNIIGQVLIDLERYEESLNFFEKAKYIQIKRKADYTETLRDIGLAKYHMGLSSLSLDEKETAKERFTEALSSFFEGLKILRDYDDESRLREIADFLMNIGRVYKEMDDNENSIKYCQEALAILKKLPNENDIGVVLTIIAEVYTREEKYESSLEYYEQAINISRRVYRGYHPGLAVMLTAKSNVLNRLERYEEAKSVCREAYEIRKLTLPSIHPEVAKYLNNLGIVLYKQEYFEDALLHHLKALEILKKCKNQELLDEEYAETINCIALVKNRLQEFKEAIESFNESLKYRIKLPSITGSRANSSQGAQQFSNQSGRKKKNDQINLPPVLEFEKKTFKKDTKHEKTSKEIETNEESAEIHAQYVDLGQTDIVRSGSASKKRTGLKQNKDHTITETHEKTEQKFTNIKPPIEEFNLPGISISMPNKEVQSHGNENTKKSLQEREETSNSIIDSVKFDKDGFKIKRGNTTKTVKTKNETIETSRTDTTVKTNFGGDAMYSKTSNS